MPSFQGQLVCGAGKPCQQGSSAHAEAKPVASSRNRGFTCQLRSCQSTVLCKYQEWGGGIRDPTQSRPAARTRGEGKGTDLRISNLFPHSLRIFISIVLPFLLFFPFSSHLRTLKTQKRNQYVLLRPQQPIFLLACPKGHRCRLISAREIRPHPRTSLSLYATLLPQVPKLPHYPPVTAHLNILNINKFT